MCAADWRESPRQSGGLPVSRMSNAEERAVRQGASPENASKDVITRSIDRNSPTRRAATRPVTATQFEDIITHGYSLQTRWSLTHKRKHIGDEVKGSSREDADV